MKESFRKPKLSADNMEKLKRINAIIVRYQGMGLKLTLRQLYYQLVTQNVIMNNVKEYAKLSKLLTEGRMGGIVDWDAIEDRLRKAQKPAEWENPASIIDACISQYRLPRTKGQETYLEVWVEKDALSGVLRRVTDMYGVSLLVNRGYSSASAMYDSFKRFLNAYENGAKKCKILYLGDYDPSGMDMIRDIRDRTLEFLKASNDILELFDNLDDDTKEEIQSEIDYPDNWDELNGSEQQEYIAQQWITTKFEVLPIALTMVQIKQYNPPPNPAKRTDPRSDKFIAERGSQSWEVDALRPEVLDEILRKNIEETLDMKQWNKIVGDEKADIAKLKGLNRYL